MTNPLEQFRRAAKALKSGYEAGHTDALARIAQINPRRDGAELKHADFLHVIAQENTFVSWPAMKEAIETLGQDRAEKTQRLKIALHHGQTGVVQRLLDDMPDLGAGHFGFLCGLLDVKSVWAMLSEDPTLAVTPIGAWSPLIHLCKSRMYKVWPDKAPDAIAIADMLVANGADVNLGSTEHGDPLSPLYWALGHSGNVPLAEWLLENGADPNDGESLYHATELGHAEGVKLLLAHGAEPNGTNTLARAMDFDGVEMVAMLLDAGADPNAGSDASNILNDAQGGVPALHHAAYRMNTGPVLDLLLDRGADPAATWKGHSAYAFARVFGNSDLANRIDARGLQTPLGDIEQMLAIAATGLAPDGYIDPAKLPKAYRYILREILHLPGKLPHLKALVACGMEWDLPDEQGVTPVQLAGWSGLPDVMAYFLSLAPNLGHVNGYGGTLLSTILHGAENNPTRQQRDYVACLRLALEHGVALPRRAIKATGNAEIAAFLSDWAKNKPGQVVEHGIV